jgi:hypothetical protein
MTQLNSTREGWLPQTRQDRDAILNELREILASPHFCNSKRYPALLEYIVEATLAGNAELLKERTLGVEVFDRPPTYDTNTDTVVRYTAGEVRKRLLLYYSDHSKDSGIRISLPAGSYIPEFLRGHGEPEGKAGESGPVAVPLADSSHSGPDLAFVPSSGRATLAVPADSTTLAAKTGIFPARRLWLAVLVVGAAVSITGLWWGVKLTGPPSALNDFWGPVLHNQQTVVICTGGNVFSEKNFSGVATAGKDVSYPFVSMQIASSIAQISRLLDHSGVTPQLVSSATTPLTDLRDHSIALLGGYNNAWTLRLLDPLRFRFAPDHGEFIMDRSNPQAKWERDHSIPYSSADDYAVVARFRDTATDGWVVAMAGLGRNGTEAAAIFVTSPHYLQLLREQTGQSFGNRNIEFVLKVNVIDGKTGAPIILATHTW